MAVGLPTIIGNTGVAELLEDGVDSLFWPDLDHPQRGADLLISAMSNPARLAAIGKRGRQRYLESFSVELVAPRLASYLVEPI